MAYAVHYFQGARFLRSFPPVPGCNPHLFYSVQNTRKRLDDFLTKGYHLKPQDAERNTFMESNRIISCVRGAHHLETPYQGVMRNSRNRATATTLRGKVDMDSMKQKGCMISHSAGKSSLKSEVVQGDSDAANESRAFPRPLVYVGMCADLVHIGHVNVIHTASQHGHVVVGLLTDDAVASYKRRPIVEFENRKAVIKGMKHVIGVVPQTSLDYRPNLLALKPEFVVHGDDWKTGTQNETRANVLRTIGTWGGQLIEPPYTPGISTTQLISRAINSSSPRTPKPSEGSKESHHHISVAQIANFKARLSDFQLLPEGLARLLIWTNNHCVYHPLRRVLEGLLLRQHLPAWITPNVVTTASGAMLVPCVVSLSAGFPTVCAGFVIVHDVLDRIDGALARARATLSCGPLNASAATHNHVVGAYYDAMCDKVFFCGMLGYLLWSGNNQHMGCPWTVLACLSIGIQTVQAVHRTRDFVDHRAQVSLRGSNVDHMVESRAINALESAITAGEEGKLATFAGNLSILFSSLAVGAAAMGVSPAEDIAATAATGMLVVSLDMALRSYIKKFVG